MAGMEPRTYPQAPAVVTAVADPRREPHAYIRPDFNGRLYEVLEAQDGDELCVRSCETGYPLWLSDNEVERSVLEQLAPPDAAPDHL